MTCTVYVFFGLADLSLNNRIFLSHNILSLVLLPFFPCLPTVPSCKQLLGK